MNCFVFTHWISAMTKFEVDSGPLIFASFLVSTAIMIYQQQIQSELSLSIER